MPSRVDAIHSYYLSMFELLIFIAFVIVLKIVMLILMAKLSVMLSDDPQAAREQRDERKRRSTFDQTSAQKWLRLGLGLLFTASGLLQIQPRMVSISEQALNQDFHFTLGPTAIESLAASFGRLWVSHSTWMNVLSCGLQLLIGLLLLTASHRLAVIISAAIAAMMGLFDFVIMTGFGGLFSAGGSLLGPTPVRGLVYFAMSVLCLIPVRYWREGKPLRFMRFGIVAFWILGIILQIIPGGGYWQSVGWTRLLQSGTSSTEPKFIQGMTSTVTKFVAPHAAVLNTAVIILMVLFALSLVFIRWSYARGIQLASIVYLVLTWAVFEHLGFQTVYLFPMDAGTAVILALLMVQNGQQGQRKVKTAGQESKLHSKSAVSP